MNIEIRDLHSSDIAVCEQILSGLPEWFGLPESNQAYIDGLSRLPAAVAQQEKRIIGFTSLLLHDPGSAEIEVMAVDRSFHHRGAGRLLVDWAVNRCVCDGVSWLHVKTRGPSTPDPDYEKTRRFYRAVGFDPLFESTTLWGPDDAALVLVRKVEPSC